jgi:hypothetical protein
MWGRTARTALTVPKKVDVELPPGVRQRRKLDSAGYAEARAADKNVDPPRLGGDAVGSGGQRALVRHVGGDVRHAVQRLITAADLIDPAAGGGQRRGTGAADAGGAAGHERGLHSSCLRRTWQRMSTASSTSASVWLAMRLHRSRHSCGAQAGGSVELT